MPLISWKRKSGKDSYISGNGTFLYFRKRNFLIFWERHIQNPIIFRTRSTFRTRGIFRTLLNIYDGKFCKTVHRSNLSAVKIVSANSEGINLKGIHSRCLSVKGNHSIWRLNYYRESKADKTRGVKQNKTKNCVICCSSRKTNFKNWFITNINKPKMRYSLSIKGKLTKIYWQRYIDKSFFSCSLNVKHQKNHILNRMHFVFLLWRLFQRYIVQFFQQSELSAGL